MLKPLGGFPINPNEISSAPITENANQKPLDQKLVMACSFPKVAVFQCQRTDAVALVHYLTSSTLFTEVETKRAAMVSLANTNDCYFHQGCLFTHLLLHVHLLFLQVQSEVETIFRVCFSKPFGTNIDFSSSKFVVLYLCFAFLPKACYCSISGLYIMDAV